MTTWLKSATSVKSIFGHSCLTTWASLAWHKVGKTTLLRACAESLAVLPPVPMQSEVWRLGLLGFMMFYAELSILEGCSLVRRPAECDCQSLNELINESGISQLREKLLTWVRFVGWTCLGGPSWWNCGLPTPKRTYVTTRSIACMNILYMRYFKAFRTLLRNLAGCWWIALYQFGV